MTKFQFKHIVHSAKESTVHITYSMDHGFLALSDKYSGRVVVHQNDPYARGIKVLNSFSIPLKNLVYVEKKRPND